VTGVSAERHYLATLALILALVGTPGTRAEEGIAAPATADPLAALEPLFLQCGGGSEPACEELRDWRRAQDGSSPHLARYRDRMERALESACVAMNAKACIEAGGDLLDWMRGGRDTDRGVSLLERACDVGGPRDCLASAWILAQRGMPGAHDATRARLLERACDGDLGEGCNQLGVVLSKDEGVPADLPRALELFDRACELDMPWGCYNAAMAYLEGLGTDPDLARAREGLQRACDAGVGNACFAQGRLDFDSGAGVEAIPRFEEACHNGDRHGCTAAGALYRRFHPRDIRGERYLDRACDAGVPDGCHELAMLLVDRGQQAEAVPYFQRAVDYRRRNDGHRHADTCAAHRNLGVVLDMAGYPELAVEELNAALACSEEALGSRTPGTGSVRAALGRALDDLGRTVEAIAQLEGAIDVLDESLGPDHDDTVSAMHDLAMVRFSAGDHPAGIDLEARVHDRRLATHGELHPATARSASNLGLMLLESGDAEGALPYLESALTTRELLLGDGDLATVDAYNNLATALAGVGRYVEAEALQRVACDLRAALQGEDHVDSVMMRFNLAGLLDDQGKYVEALAIVDAALPAVAAFEAQAPVMAGRAYTQAGKVVLSTGDRTRARTLSERGREILSGILGPANPITVQATANVAACMLLERDLEGAEQLLAEAHDAAVAALGPDHPHTASMLNNLATVLAEAGEFTRAAEMFEDVAVIRHRRLGDAHPETLLTECNLGVIEGYLGRTDESFVRLEGALALAEAHLSPDHNTTALLRANLAWMYEARGEFEGALAILDRSLAATEEVKGADHPDCALPLHSLARIRLTLGESRAAIDLAERAIELLQGEAGAPQPILGFAWGILARAHEARGDLDAALEADREAGAILEAALAADDPRLAGHWNNLGLHAARSGDLETAQEMYSRALALFAGDGASGGHEKRLVLQNLTLTQIQLGDPLAAGASLDALLAEEEGMLARHLAIGSSEESMTFAQLFTESTTMVVSWNLTVRPDDAAATRRSLQTLVRRKGRVLDSESGIIRRARADLDQESTALLDDLRRAMTELDALNRRPAAETSPDLKRASLLRKREEVVGLRQALARRGAGLDPEAEAVDLERVGIHIPDAAALVEYVLYEPMVFPDVPGQAVSWGLPRYGVYVLFPDGRIHAVDLGGAGAIHLRMAELRGALQRREDPRGPATALHAALLAPLEESLAGVDHLIVSPDGELGLLPWGALVDGEGRYLGLGDRLITTVTSGRDLLHLAEPAEVGGAALVIADVDFDGHGSRADADDLPAGPTAPHPGPVESCGGPWARLPHTAEEGARIAGLLPGSTLLRGSEATETALKETRAPRVLHVASHGCFAGAERDGLPSGGRGARRTTGARDSIPLLSALGLLANTGGGEVLLDSGIVLAGANGSWASDDNGFLSAAELSLLDLRGTELAVLSACETGVGEVRFGEGVMGLRRALLLAGARTQVLSLWTVADDATARLMMALYEALLDGMPRGEALRRARRDLAADPRWSHPYFWASFELSGAWEGYTPLPR